ncbi:hypothetical protein E2C01_052066 [Portunus trituberculatus]|uniref:Uncharacterized protein n=1 Tax=Portunus trituberculatus TaxID=210409 RepID=A0A5B7GDF9_PORTR|nr:hypothetical protein [Portunus trituberculatus]
MDFQDWWKESAEDDLDKSGFLGGWWRVAKKREIEMNLRKDTEGMSVSPIKGLYLITGAASITPSPPNTSPIKERNPNLPIITPLAAY